MAREKQIPFDKVLESLMDVQHPFPPIFLARFTDLPEPDFVKLKRIWRDIATERKISLLEDLEDILDSDTIVSYTGIARLAIKDAEPQVRELAIRLLWDSEDVDFIPTFIEMAQHDPAPSVRAIAASILGTFVLMGEYEEISAEEKKQIEDTLFSIYANETDANTRRRALESISFSSLNKIHSLIQSAFQQPEDAWKASALTAMGRSQSIEKYGKIILGYLNSNHYDLQMEAIRAAGVIELSAARQPLLDLLETGFDDDELRNITIWSLSHIGGDGVRKALQKLLDEAEEDDEDTDFLEDALDTLTVVEEINAIDLDGYDLDEDDTSDESPATN